MRMMYDFLGYVLWIGRTTCDFDGGFQDDNYVFLSMWAKDKTVQKALQIREGTKREWTRCNSTMYNVLGKNASISYAFDVTSTVGIHRSLVSKRCRALIFRYVTTFSKNDHYSMTFATLKGGGHSAPMYQPKECLAMVDRWFADYPL
ncbi:hypothetical protein LguiB_022010 [Lonicera macranthoides]